MYLLEEKPFDDRFDKESFFFYNCNDNFIILDNIEKEDNKTLKKEEFFCSSFYIAVFVKSGSMKIIVNGNLFVVNENQFFLILPCNRVEFIQSSAVFFMSVTRAHIVQNQYEHMKSNVQHKRLVFNALHFKLSEKHLENICMIYKLLKSEAKRPNYFYKELVIKEMKSVIVYELISKLDLDSEIKYFPESKQYNIFCRFVELLNKEFITQRSVNFYADSLGITAKYLSFVSSQFTNKSASVVIDIFVVSKIKTLLYEGELSVKKISEMFNFKSQSFFGRYFKRMTGMSPRNFIVNYNRHLF